MSRRVPYVSKPRCVHHEAIHRQYEAACEAAWKTGNPRPEAQDASGYCDDCHRALFTPGAIWPPEYWAYLDAQAARDYCPTKPLRPYKLPPAPKARREKLDKLHARASDAYRPLSAPDPEKSAQYVGCRCGDGWYVETTNGHCAIVRRGAGTQDRSVLPALTTGYGDDWIALEDSFYLALQRVRVFANERSEAITLSYAPERDASTVRLYARSLELGEAWEDVPFVERAGRRLSYETVLNASYLDACLGVWPLRWYLRPPEQHDRAARQYERGDDEGRVRWTEDQIQVFEPEGADWRAAIMPMRP